MLVVRWNGLEILIPKHMWKRKIRLLEQKLDTDRYVTFFLGTPCILFIENETEKILNCVTVIMMVMMTMQIKGSI